MEKSFGTRILAMMLAAALALGVLPGALAAEEGETGCWALDGGDWSWFYVPSTVPEQFRESRGGNWVELYQQTSEGMQYEYAVSIEITFVSGDEHLKDVFRIGQEEYERGIVYPAYEVNLEKVKEPGRAVFHFSCASEHFQYEKDVPLRVLSWKEDPLFTFERKSEPGEVTTFPGGLIYPNTFMDGLAIEDHSGEIAEKLSRNGDPVEKPNMYGDISFDEYSTGFCYPESYNVREGYPEEPAEGKAIESLYSGETGDTLSWRFNSMGQFNAWYHQGWSGINAAINEALGIVHVLPYRIDGPKNLAPGASAEYAAVDLEQDSGRSFTLSLEGEGVTLTENSGNSDACTVSAAEDAEIGKTFTLTATPSDGGTPAVLKCTVDEGVIAEIPLVNKGFMYDSEFTVPVFSTASGEYESGYIQNIMNIMVSRPVDRNSLPYWPGLTYSLGGGSFFPDREAKVASLKERAAKYIEANEGTIQEEEILDVQGEPALIAAGLLKNEGRTYPFGFLYTIQNNTALQAELIVFEGTGADPDQMPLVTLSDMRRLAEKIEYDESKAILTRADGAVTVSAKKGETEITGGKKVQMTAAFANTEKVNKKEKNDGVEWSVIDLETGETPEDISIDQKGNLSAKKDLAVVRKLQVKAVSTTFYTEGTYEITAIPAVKKMTVDPAELFFYVGTEESKTVRALLEPDTVPPTGITWTPAKKDMLEIEAGEDGTAKIRPLAGGKTTVAVKEPSGKNAKLTVSVVEPVTEVTLTSKGKAQAGKTITVSAALSPKKAGNKDLEWSLDVDESIATINAKGSVKIDKAAPAGTVITVTCRALGAPEPVSATLAITVE
ncbi:MAG: Ig-like domain-containing protein [Clostridia bacterium]|nr:Ig-like domain-containing protein [Clostridia bacterium]